MREQAFQSHRNIRGLVPASQLAKSITICQARCSHGKTCQLRGLNVTSILDHESSQRAAAAVLLFLCPSYGFRLRNIKANAIIATAATIAIPTGV